MTAADCQLSTPAINQYQRRPESQLPRWMRWSFYQLPWRLHSLCELQVSRMPTATSSASFRRLLSAIHSFTVEGNWGQLWSCTSFPDIIAKSDAVIGDWIFWRSYDALLTTQTWCSYFDGPIDDKVSLLHFGFRKCFICRSMHCFQGTRTAVSQQPASS